jgi:hypothetical protein
VGGRRVNGERVKEGEYGQSTLYMLCENRTAKPVEIILSSGKGG